MDALNVAAKRSKITFKHILLYCCRSTLLHHRFVHQPHAPKQSNNPAIETPCKIHVQNENGEDGRAASKNELLCVLVDLRRIGRLPILLTIATCIHSHVFVFDVFSWMPGARRPAFVYSVRVRHTDSDTFSCSHYFAPFLTILIAFASMMMIIIWPRPRVRANNNNKNKRANTVIVRRIVRETRP